MAMRDGPNGTFTAGFLERTGSRMVLYATLAFS